MKFKDLKEDGTEYMIKSVLVYTKYIKIDGGLWCVATDAWCTFDMGKIMRLEFEEVVNYVTVEEAFEHMDGLSLNFAKFNGVTYTTKGNVFREVKHLIKGENGCPVISFLDCNAAFTSDMLQPKWVLL